MMKGITKTMWRECLQPFCSYFTSTPIATCFVSLHTWLWKKNYLQKQHSDSIFTFVMPVTCLEVKTFHWIFIAFRWFIVTWAVGCWVECWLCKSIQLRSTWFCSPSRPLLNVSQVSCCVVHLKWIVFWSDLSFIKLLNCVYKSHAYFHFYRKCLFIECLAQ